MDRPSFAAAWAAATRIYDPANSEAKVAQVIGGDVEKNINNPDPAQRWTNTCAARMGYIFNQSGVTIPSRPGQTVPGAEKRQYCFRVRNLIAFLEQRWGKPEIVQ
ncbi:T6SS effector amidase Tae4 family protein [Ralstonia solanacearum]|uniref:T6SS effector amidase Tae4 family protein n=1 Tax=Ralstonia solanacearum TaxID=305 RepID=UPI001E3285D5|nr:T6SS effector amidase Tae4 family protein [Ralstonia solanacearum]